jgi:glutamate--cysteine ligase
LSPLQQLLSTQSENIASTLDGIRRGIEKESLRVTLDGKLAQTPHPRGLGSALTHPQITTDFSEALLEFITPVEHGIASSLTTLEDIHRFVYSVLQDELLWAASMPCSLEKDAPIPLANYGKSNVGRMKTLYRNGLGHRYGRAMQTIAGIHYNFSLPDTFWALRREQQGSREPLQSVITEGYLGLIRNFWRRVWLPVYLFGAAPALCRSFIPQTDGKHGLLPHECDATTLYAPYATSLRMGDLGYQSDAQGSLNICYNSLDRYVETLQAAILTPYPDYVRIGTGTASDRKQLNTGLLQIENEFYSPIRPKRVARSGEPPLHALALHGIEYVEVRCIDISPFEPVGISAEQIRFLDAFLLACVLDDSPLCDVDDYARQRHNLRSVVMRGREPGLCLETAQGARSLREWSNILIDDIERCAALLDAQHGGHAYRDSVAAQRRRIADPALTPSAKLLAEMESSRSGFAALAMDYSQRWRQHFLDSALTAATQTRFAAMADASWAQHAAVEAAQELSFEEHLARYYAQYQELSEITVSRH